MTLYLHLPHTGGHYRQESAIDRWSLQVDDHYRQIAATDRLHYRKVVAIEWLLVHVDGRCRRLAATGRWSLRMDGIYSQMDAIDRWSKKASGR